MIQQMILVCSEFLCSGYNICAEVFGCALRPGVHEEGLPKTHELPADLLSINQIFTMDKLYASLGAPRQEGTIMAEA